MLSKLKDFNGRLTYPQDAFYDGYEHKLLVGIGRCKELASERGFKWATLKQNWLGLWRVDESQVTYSTEDLQNFAEEQSK